MNSASPILIIAALGAIIALLPHSDNYPKLFVFKDLQCMLCKAGHIGQLTLIYLAFFVFSLLVLSLATTRQVLAQPVIDLSIIAQIESSNNPHAIGDDGRSFGLFQLSTAVIDDYNIAHHTHIAHSSALERITATFIAEWYLQERIPQMLRYYKIPITTDSVLISYNFGIGKTIKWYRKGAILGQLPQSTKNYLVKYASFKNESN